MTLSAHLFPLETLAEARSGGPEAERIREAFTPDVPALVERWLSGAPLQSGVETVDLMEQLVLAQGRTLPNRLFGGLRMKPIDAVDGTLSSHGVPSGFRVGRLVMGGCPVKSLPSPPASPSLGFVTADALAEAALHFETGEPTSEDADVDGVLAEMSDWFAIYRYQQARVSRPLGLVGFYFA